jgi:hypothetical protein
MLIQIDSGGKERKMESILRVMKRMTGKREEECKEEMRKELEEMEADLVSFKASAEHWWTHQALD